MANAKAVWGIDVGQCALKAVRLQVAADGAAEVTHFDVIEHPKILSQSDADAEQLIHNALDKFLSRNEIGHAAVAVSVPGQSSFARFIKLPPVEPKRIPEIVRFEAVQQIPFDIEEVEWDYQTFTSDKSPDVEVGLFAMRKELVIKQLANLRAAQIDADIVQLAPLALYNMMVHDEQVAPTGATILIDVGAENTDLVIADGERIWLRSIPLGGNNFTEALVKAFKLPFSKAENLKRTAATSKYARQIFVAMRPVFGDLVGEVQRSIGFYTALHRDAHMSRVLCLGNAFRLPGLQKYLEQNLQIETVRPSAFNRLKATSTVSAPAFAENLLSFGVAYGLAIQGLGLAPIRSNLLPFAIARQRNWRAQRPWFAAAAAALVLGVGVACVAASNGAATYGKLVTDWQGQVEQPQAADRQIKQNIAQRTGEGKKELEEIDNIKRISGYRDVALEVVSLVQEAFPNDFRDGAFKLARKANADLAPDRFLARGMMLETLQANREKWRDLFSDNDPCRDIYMLESLQLEFFTSRPARLAPGAVPAPTAPMVNRAATDGVVVQSSDTGAAAAAPAAAEKWYRVTIVGVTNVPPESLAGNIKARFLDAIRERVRLAQGGPMLKDIQLDEESLNQALIRFPAVVEGGALDKGVDGGPRSTDPWGCANPADRRFTVSFNVRVMPAGQEQPNK